MKRPFRGLRDRPPAAAYDAVVIGAGIGGLFAAVELARQGASVLLVEQHYMVGGYCSTFRRAGYDFDASTHFYPLLGNPATITGKLLGELGLATDWVRMDPVDTFHFPDGSHFHVPAELGPYRAAVDALFPHQREGLDRFFEAVREAYLHGVLYHFRGKRTARYTYWADWTLRRALDTFLSDPGPQAAAHRRLRPLGLAARAAPRSSSTPCCGSPISSATTIRKAARRPSPTSSAGVSRSWAAIS